MSRIFLKKEIIPLLMLLNQEYQKASKLSSPKALDLINAYCITAIISVGGWIEDGIDRTAELSYKKIKNIDTRKFLEDSIKRIHGFEYKRHISTLLCMSFGSKGLDYIESNIGQPDIYTLSTALGKIEMLRNPVAHSMHHIPIVPNQLIADTLLIFPILSKIERYARKYVNSL